MLNSEGEIKIEISNTKGIVITIFATIVFAVGIWAIIKFQFINSEFDRLFLTILSSLLVITFGFLSFVGLERIIKKEEGLLINDVGIKINFGPNKGQFVKWVEVTEFKIYNQLQGPLYLLLFVKDPEKYVKSSYGLKRFLLRMNNKSHKTPLSIATNWLECNIEDLILIMEKKLKNGAQQIAKTQKGQLT